MLNFRRTEHHLRWIFLTIILVSGLGWFANTFTPNQPYLLAIFLFLFAAVLFSLVMFVLNNVRRGVLCGIGAAIFLILRYLGLRDIYFPVLLIILIILVDAYFSKKKISTDR